MTTLEQQRASTLDAAQQIVDRAKSAGRSMSDAERRDVQSKIDQSERLLSQIRDASDEHELRQKLGKALGGYDEQRPGDVGRFSAKTAARALVEQMMPFGMKAIAPSGAAVAPAGLTAPEPIPLDRPARGLLAVIAAQQVAEPPTVSYMRQTTRTNNAAVVASGSAKPVSLMGLVRVDTALSVVATLTESLDRYWLRDSQALQQWVQTELTGDVDVAIEALIMSTLVGTSGVQTQAFSTDIAETLRKAETKVQLAGGAAPFVILNPLDFEALSLLRSAGPEKLFVGSSSVLQSVPGGAVAPPTGASALLSWSMPVVLSIAATAGTAWVVSEEALRLFVDGSVLIDWSDAAGFATNQVTGRCETRCLPAVLKPFSCVKATTTGA